MYNIYVCNFADVFSRGYNKMQWVKKHKKSADLVYDTTPNHAFYMFYIVHKVIVEKNQVGKQ